MAIIIGTLAIIVLIESEKLCSELNSIARCLKEIDRKLSKEYKS